MRGIENTDGQLISEPSCSHGGFYNTYCALSYIVHLMAAMLIFIKLQLNQLPLASDLDLSTKTLVVSIPKIPNIQYDLKL